LALQEAEAFEGGGVARGILDHEAAFFKASFVVLGEDFTEQKESVFDKAERPICAWKIAFNGFNSNGIESFDTGDEIGEITGRREANSIVAPEGFAVFITVRVTDAADRDLFPLGAFLGISGDLEIVGVTTVQRSGVESADEFEGVEGLGFKKVINKGSADVKLLPRKPVNMTQHAETAIVADFVERPLAGGGLEPVYTFGELGEFLFAGADFGTVGGVVLVEFGDGGGGAETDNVDGVVGGMDFFSGVDTEIDGESFEAVLCFNGALVGFMIGERHEIETGTAACAGNIGGRFNTVGSAAVLVDIAFKRTECIEIGFEGINMEFAKGPALVSANLFDVEDVFLFSFKEHVEGIAPVFGGNRDCLIRDPATFLGNLLSGIVFQFVGAGIFETAVIEKGNDFNGGVGIGGDKAGNDVKKPVFRPDMSATGIFGTVHIACEDRRDNSDPQKQ